MKLSTMHANISIIYTNKNVITNKQRQREEGRSHLGLFWGSTYTQQQLLRDSATYWTLQLKISGLMAGFSASLRACLDRYRVFSFILTPFSKRCHLNIKKKKIKKNLSKIFYLLNKKSTKKTKKPKQILITSHNMKYVVYVIYLHCCTKKKSS